jgi:hypothetical protein
VAVTAYYQKSPTSEQAASGGGLPGELAALARLANTEARARATAALAQIDRAEALAKRWKTEAEPLLTNDTGRAIASSTDLLKEFQTVWASKPPATEFADSRANLAVLIAPLTGALENPNTTATPSKQTTNVFDAERRRAENLANSYSKSLDDIAKILARVAALQLSPAATPLREAMEHQRIEQGAVTAIERETAEHIEKMRAESKEYQELYHPQHENLRVHPRAR